MLQPNSRLLTDAYLPALRASFGAAKPERWGAMNRAAAKWILATALMAACVPSAQATDDFAPISRADLLGYWRELPFPAETARRFQIRTTVPYDCQYLHIRDDGLINKISVTFGPRGGSCPDAAEVRGGFDAAPVSTTGSTRFRFVPHASGNSLLVAVGPDQPQGEATWLLMRVGRDRPWNTVELRQGDLLMFLWLKTEKTPVQPIVFARWLRPISDGAQPGAPADRPSGGR